MSADSADDPFGVNLNTGEDETVELQITRQIPHTVCSVPARVPKAEILFGHGELVASVHCRRTYRGP